MILKIKIILAVQIAGVLTSSVISAQGAENLSARAAAMGYAWSCLSGKNSVPVCNPAVLSDFRLYSLSSSLYSPYAIPGLSETGLFLCFPLSGGGMQIALSSYGNTLYQEESLGLSYGIRMDHVFSLGLETAGCHTKIQGYGNYASFLFRFGVFIRISETVRSGLCLSRSLDCDSDIPGELTIQGGCSYSCAAGFLICVDLAKHPFWPLEFRSALELRPFPPLAIRCGFRTGPGRACFGWELTHGRLSLQYGLEIHPVLGQSHHITLITFLGSSS